jgi:hypothetical protein
MSSPGKEAAETPMSPLRDSNDIGSSPSCSSTEGLIDADSIVEEIVPAPPAIEAIHMGVVREAINVGDGNKSTPQHMFQVATRLSRVLEGHFEGSGMALGEKITKMLCVKNRNRAGQRKASDGQKQVRTATDGFLSLLDSSENKFSWFPANNNKKCGVLMVTSRHYREDNTDNPFTTDDGTVWDQVTCSAHQLPGTSTH